MLAPVSRFRYTKTYAYGATAFVAGFAGIMALLVHYSPVHVPNTNVVSISDAKDIKKESTDTTPAAATNADTTTASTTNPAATTSMMTTPTANTPASTSPVTDTPTTPVVTTPTDPVDPTVPVEDPGTDPIIPGLPIDVPELPATVDVAPLLSVSLSI